MTKMNIDSTLIYWHNLNKLYEMLREERYFLYRR